MKDDSWAPIDPRNWREIPHTKGRLATQDDVRAGRAVFYLDIDEDRAAPATLALPACALQRMEDGVIRPVVVIQAEVLRGETILGVRYLPGGKGVCYLDEVELVDGPESWLAGVAAP